MSKYALFVICVVFSAFPAVTPAGEMEIPNRIAKARPGEWVRYKLSRDMYRQFTVVGFEETGVERNVVLKSQTLMNREVVKDEETSHPVSESNVLLKDFADSDLAQSGGSVKVKGKDMDAVILSGTKDGVPFSVYTSDQIPVFGLIRLDLFGETFFKIDDYGFDNPVE